MANQSFVSVPPNVDDPTVLRRFLSRLVEQVDVAFGNRAGEDTSYVKQEQLLEASDSLEEAVHEAQTSLEALLVQAEDIRESDLKAISAKLDSLQSNLTTLNNITAIKGVVLKFTVDGSNAIVHELDWNIDTASSTRTGVGVYQFEVDQATFYGIDVIDNSSFATDYLITPTATTEFYTLEVNSISTGVFTLTVKQVIKGEGNKLDVQPYDIQPGDLVSAIGVFNLPQSTLPPP